jgi:acetylornithine deacetylase/succinyl-diaminopimelate desuccinylase-like protein
VSKPNRSTPGAGWKTDPFEPVVVDGSIVGRGALAAKGPLAAVMAAAVALKPMEKLLKGQLVIVAYPDHTVAVADGQDGCGIDYLLTEGLVKADFAIIPDVGKDLRGISVAEKGRALLRIRASGKRVHGAVPERGDNAIMKMVRLLHRLSSMTLPYKPHELMGRPTLNVGCISGGLSGSTVPAECEISVDIRYLPGQTATAIVAEIRKMAEEVGGGLEFVVESDSKPCQIDPDNILVRSIQENTSTLLGFEAKLAGTGRATVARKFLQRGALAVGFGPGNEVLYDAVGESVDGTQLFDYARIIAGVIVDLFT